MIELLQKLGKALGWVFGAVGLLFGAGVAWGTNEAERVEAKFEAHVETVHPSLNEKLATIQAQVAEANAHAQSADMNAQRAAEHSKVAADLAKHFFGGRAPK